MGYDYRGSGASTRRLDRPARPARATPRRHDQGLHRPRAGVQAHPRACRTTAGPGRRRRATSKRRTRAARSTGRPPRSCTARRRRAREATGGATTAARASPGSAYKRQNCTATYGCVTSWRQVYYRRRPVAQARATTWSTAPAPGRRDLGARLRRARPELYRRSRSSSCTTRRRPRRASRSCRPRPATRASSSRGGPRTTRRSAGTTSMSRWTAARGRPGSGTRRRHRTCSSARTVTATRSGSGRATRAATWARGTSRPASTAARPSPPGGFGRVRVDGLSPRGSPDTRALKVATFSARRGPGHPRRPGQRRRVHLVQGRWRAARVEHRGLHRGAGSGSPHATPRRASSARPQAPGATRIDAGIDPLRIGAGVLAPSPPSRRTATAPATGST